MKKIKLTQGSYALVDDTMYPILSTYKWHLTAQGYAATRINNKIVLMHRFIVNCPKTKIVDHIDHRRLNNQLSNLRLCSYTQNNMNVPRTKKANATSKYRGVSWDDSIQVYKARVGKKYIGAYKTEEEAALAYDIAAKEMHGDFAILNNIDQTTVVSHRRTTQTSKYTGVYWFPNKNKWKAQIMHQCKQRHIGYFENEDDAAIAWNTKAIEFRGPQTKLNIIGG